MAEPMHVSMSAEAYARIPKGERAAAWQTLIRKAGVTGAYLPIPFEDASRNIVGMNILRLEEEAHD